MLEKKRVQHALLFAGPEGVGKSLFAKDFALELLGENARKKALCPDLHFYRPEGKSGLHTIESMRELIKEAHLPPFESPCKVFLIDEPTNMLPASANALLKTFEEPPLNTYFILISSKPEALLPTILSRFIKISFFPVSTEEIIKLLKHEHAAAIARLAQGSIAKALKITQQENNELTTLIHRLLICENYSERLSLITEIEKYYDNETQDTDSLFEHIAAYYRDQHLLKCGVDSPYLLSEYDTPLKSLPSLEKVIQEISKARFALERNIKLKHVVEQMACRLLGTI